MVSDRHHFAKTIWQYNYPTRTKERLSHATSVRNKRKQMEDRKTFVVSNIVSIVSYPSKKADQIKVHAIKDLLQCSMSSAWLVFALYLNQISHPKMFLTSHLRTMRTSNQKKFRYIFVPYGHVLVPLHVPLRICSFLIFMNLLLLIHTSVHFSLFLSFFWFFLCFPKLFVFSLSFFLRLKIFLSFLSTPHCIIMTQYFFLSFLSLFIMRKSVEACGCLFLSGWDRRASLR